MKLFIQVLDNGYTLSVTRMVEQEGVEIQLRPRVEEKRRYAFETVAALKAKLNELLPGAQ